MKAEVIVPWYDRARIEAWRHAWGVGADPPDFLRLVQDSAGAGCAATKNRGIRQAIDAGAEVVVVLDDDCHPCEATPDLESLVSSHLQALEPQDVDLFQVVTDPPSRGTPYFSRTLRMPVAASMGFWIGVGDYDAPGQLVHGATHPMGFRREAIHGRWFPLSGMNLAFRVEWWPWCQFIEVPRFDDIWMGFLWQKVAYERGHCFNLAGPTVRHARGSDVWSNLLLEAIHLEANETLWRDIAMAPGPADYAALRRLLPV